MVMYKTIECNYMATNKNINRIKVVLVEKKKTNKWLADLLVPTDNQKIMMTIL